MKVTAGEKWKKMQSFDAQIFPPFRTQCQRKKKYGHVGPNQRVGHA